MHFTSAELITYISAYLWPFTRIGGMVAAAPIFGTRMLPMRVRLTLALALTLVIAPIVPPVPSVDVLSAPGILITAQQLLIGLAMGFILQLSFAAFVFGGQVIAMTMGLGFASMNDPATGISVPTVSQLYTVLVTLVFFALDGHLLVVQVMAESFKTLPIGVDGLSLDKLWLVLTWASQMFVGAMFIALPVIGAMLVVNLGFGVMTRASPQLNIFAVGFPVIMTLGFIMILFSLPSVVPRFTELMRITFDVIRELTRLGG